MIKKYPLTGVGLGNFQLAAKKYFNKDITEMAHNVFLHYGAEAGIFSMVILLIIVMKYFWDTFGIYKKLPNDGFFQLLLSCSTISFLGLFISAQFGDPFVRNTKEFFVLLLALPYLIKSSSERLRLEKNCPKIF